LEYEKVINIESTTGKSSKMTMYGNKTDISRSTTVEVGAKSFKVSCETLFVEKTGSTGRS
jgi:hypothetical protein